MPINCIWGGGSDGRGPGLNVLTLFYRRITARQQTHRMQQDFQILTAEIGGLDGKTKECIKQEASWRLVVNQFSYLSQSANEVIKIKFMLKKGVKVNQATQPAAGRAALSLRQGWKTSLRFSRGDTWMFIVCWNAYSQISSFKNQRVNSSHTFVYLFHNTRSGLIEE